MDNKKYILKSNEAYQLITNAIMENRVIEDGKLLTPSEVEELIYCYLEDIYNEDLFNIRLTKDNEDEEQIIIDQIRFGDIVATLNNGKIITNEVKSEKPYKGLYYKLRIDIEYSKRQSNTGDCFGWIYHLVSYNKLYVHFHDYTNKYKASIYVINNPYQLMLDIKDLLYSGKLEYNKPYLHEGVWFEVFPNPIDGYKTTICTSFDLSSERARERYDIDLIHLEVRSEE